MANEIIRATRPLRHPLGDRLPLYISMLQTLDGTDSEMEENITALNRRGMAVCATWKPREAQEASLERALRIGRIQKRLGLRVNVNATSCMYSVCDGSPETAHIDGHGNPSFDTSCDERRKLGCPFRLKPRYPVIREQVDFFCRAYEREGIAVDFVWTDWEIDGPIEWNDGWSSAKRCIVCRENIADINDFISVQRAYRRIRSEMERECYSSVVLKHFPRALVGNYAVYPNDGWRYWYDYFEREPDGAVPVRKDRNARYRPWPDEFTPCGYTYAMPVVYPWHRIWHWYDWENGDYRWFYNMLLAAGNAAQNTPPGVPIIPFVHRETIFHPSPPDPNVRQMSEKAYRELLWHMLLRGHDTFFIWGNDVEKEIPAVHEVWAAALEYRDFLDCGKPVTFHVPDEPGPVVSGLLLGERLLVRRTDFDGTTAPVSLGIGNRAVEVPRAEGQCQVLQVAER